MSPPPTSIDGSDITGSTIDGQEVQEITVDGQTVFTAGPAPAPVNRMYAADFSNGLIRQFDLTNKFDLTGATETGTFKITNPRDVTIADSGNRLIVSASSDGLQEMYTLSTPYDVNTAGSVTSTLASNNCHGISIDPSGVNVLSSLNGGNEEFEYYTLATPFDLTTATLQDSEVIFTGGAFDIDFTNQGEFVFATNGNAEANRWTLTTPFDFTTRTNKQTYSIENNDRGIHVTDDGSKYFSASFGDGEVEEYNLSTPYDLSSRGTPVDTLSVPNAIGLHLV